MSLHWRDVQEENRRTVVDRLNHRFGRTPFDLEYDDYIGSDGSLLFPCPWCEGDELTLRVASQGQLFAEGRFAETSCCDRTDVELLGWAHIGVFDEHNDSGNSSFSSFISSLRMSEKAFYGIAGEIVHAIEPHSEADPAAILAQLLVCVGNAWGRGPSFHVEADSHHTNLFAVIVGATSKGRKGVSFGQASRLVEIADSSWRHVGGLSSGEGLIHHVRDPSYRLARSKDEKARADIDGFVCVDEGVEDKRLLAVETEFSSVLSRMGRDSNTLSEIIRQAWDGKRLGTLTKATPEKATGTHISIIAHITGEELERALTKTDMANGFSNRFLWVCVNRSKQLPHGGDVANIEWGPLHERLRKAIEFAKSIEDATFEQDGHLAMLRENGIPFDHAAGALWEKFYDAWWNEEHVGLFGSVISRREAQVRRLAVIYAVLDCADEVRVEHLEAAVAVWDYTEAGCRRLFGDSLGDPMVDALLSLLKAGGNDGLTRKQITDAFSRNKSSEEIRRGLHMLDGQGLAHSESVKASGRGRPAERWFYGAAVRAKRTKRTKSEPADNPNGEAE